MNQITKEIQSMIPKKDRELVFQFFVVFSRFEYALKSAGLVKMGKTKAGENPKPPKKVEADWDRFADECDVQFNPASSPELKHACDYFQAHPPQKQSFEAGTLGWKETPSKAGLTYLNRLLLSVRRVRNNMFHGGKFPLNAEEGDGRNVMLLQYALVVLEACADLDGDVHHHLIHRS